MKSLTSTVTKQILFFILMLMVSELSFGQTSIEAIGNTYSQNFNGLSSVNTTAWLDNSTMIGWYARTDGTATINAYRVSTGSTPTITAALYSIGSTNNIERSLGYLPGTPFTGNTSSSLGYIGWRLKNLTGVTIGSIKVIWTGEQWRKAVDLNKQYIKVSYKVGTSLTDLVTGYTQTTSSFESPIANTNNAEALDGNLAVNRTEGITLNLPVVIPPGSEIVIRWEDKNDPANHILSIDDVSFQATKQTQTITFDNLPTKTFGDNPFTLTATASSGLAVTYESSNMEVATINGSTVTITGAGFTEIKVKQTGNNYYVAADSVVRILNVKPRVPIANSATSIEVMSFTANWSPANGAASYYLYYGTDESFTTYNVASVGNVTSFNLTGLMPSTNYFYKVQSFNTGIYSDDSNIISVMTAQGIQASNIIATKNFTDATLNWTNGNLGNRAVFVKQGEGLISNPVDYFHYYGTTDWELKGDQLGESGYYNVYYGSDSSIKLTNLFPGTLYTVHIFEYVGGEWDELYLKIAGVNNPITFSTWGTTTWTNTTGVASAEDYATVARWDHATVPTAALHPAVKVYIDGNCEVSTHAVANNLTINASHDAINSKLTINTSSSLMVTDVLTNNNGASALLIKSGSSAPNGSLIFRNAYGSPVQATVEMFSKATKVGTSYKWQFFGIPVRTYAKNPTFVDGVNYVRKFNEAGTGSGYTTDKHWIQLVDGNSLTPFTGYEVTQAAAKTYTFGGELVTGDFNSGMLAYTSTAQYPGQHLIGNPYTAAINISDIEFGTTDVGIIENSVYLYNTGSLDEWTSAGSGTASINESSTPGQYIVIPKNVAGRGTGIPGQIPSMQAFLVKVKRQDLLGWVKITYPANNAATSLGKNTTLQRAPSADLPCTRIDVKGTSFGDRMWIFTEPTCTKGFDNGWDGYKEERIGTAVPKLYAKEASGNYQVNSVDDIHNSMLGFVAGTGTDYTFTFTHQNIESVYPKLYLFDTFTGNYTNITQSGTQYSFASSNTLDTESRFKIVTAIDNTTETSRLANNGLKLSNYQNTMVVQNSTSFNGNLELYDITGRIIKVFTFEANATTRIPVSISAGSYIVKAQTNTDKITLPIIIR